MTPRTPIRLAAAARLTLLITGDHHPAVERAKQLLARPTWVPAPIAVMSPSRAALGDTSDAYGPVAVVCRHVLQAAECPRCTAPWTVALITAVDRGPGRLAVDVLAGALAVEYFMRGARRADQLAPIVVTAPS